MPRPAEVVLARLPGWIKRAEKVHRKLQRQGPTPELLAEFQDMAADYVTTNLVRPYEDGSTSSSISRRSNTGSIHCDLDQKEFVDHLLSKALYS